MLIALLCCACSHRPDSRHLELWTISLKPKYIPYMERVIKAFEAEHGVEVDWIDLPQASILQKLMASIAGGVPPDVVNLTTASALTLAHNGALADLSSCSHLYKDRFYPNLWEAASYNGGVYAVPWYLSTRVLIYNKELLKRSGIRPEELSDKETLAEVSRRLKGTDACGWIPVVRILDDWRMAGIKVHDDKGRALFDTPEAAACLSRYANLYSDDLVPKDFLIEGYQGAIERYKQNGLAVLEAGPQLLLKIKADAPSVYEATGIAPLPLDKAGIVPASMMNLVVPSSSQHKKLAAELAFYIANAKNQLDFAKEVPLLPSACEAAEDEFFRIGKGEALQDEAMRVSVAQLPLARDCALSLPHASDLEKVLKEAVESCIYGKMTAQEALHQAAAEWNEILGLS